MEGNETIEQIAELLKDFSEDEKKKILEVITVASGKRILDMSKIEDREKIVKRLYPIFLTNLKTDANYDLLVSYIEEFKEKLLNIECRSIKFEFSIRNEKEMLIIAKTVGYLCKEFIEIKVDFNKVYISEVGEVCNIYISW